MMTSSAFVYLMLLFCFSIGLSQAEVYQWVNDEGEIVFGDSPPSGTDANMIELEDAVGSGAKFATPEQIEKFHNGAQAQNKSKSKSGTSSQLNSYCRGYQSDLNKIEIYLQHTYSVKDAQKARDLRKLIKRECGGVNFSAKDNRSRCNRYHQDMVKIEIYLEHTPNPRDKQRVKDLRKQIARECQ